MKQLIALRGFLAICALMMVFTGCEDENEGDSVNGVGGGLSGNAPASLRAREYEITEPGGTTVVIFSALGTSYTLTRPGIAQESGSYVATKVGIDTWDIVLNNALDGSASRLVLTFTGNGAGNFSFTPPNSTSPITGQFQRSGLGSTTTGTTTTGTTTTGTTTGTTTTGGGGVTAPATLSQIVINGRAGNPRGSAQSVINIAGGTFVYSGGSPSGTVIYTPSGSTASLRLDYSGAAAGDVDSYSLNFLGAPGSTTLSSYSGTQTAGNVTGPASGTFTYTQ